MRRHGLVLSVLDPGYRYGRDQDHEHGGSDDYCDHILIHASPLRESARDRQSSATGVTIAGAEATVGFPAIAAAPVRPRHHPAGVLLMGNASP